MVRSTTQGQWLPSSLKWMIELPTLINLRNHPAMPLSLLDSASFVLCHGRSSKTSSVLRNEETHISGPDLK
jgi:hypothetical protein